MFVSSISWEFIIFVRWKMPEMLSVYNYQSEKWKTCVKWRKPVLKWHMEQSQPSTVALREFRLKCEIEIYKSFNKSVCKNASGTRGMCQRMNTVTMVAMNKHKLLRERAKKVTQNSEYGYEHIVCCDIRCLPASMQCK